MRFMSVLAIASTLVTLAACSSVAPSENDPAHSVDAQKTANDTPVQLRKSRVLPPAVTAPYAPCAGKNLGDTCTVCDPTNPLCVETQEVKACDSHKQCTSAGSYDPCAGKNAGDVCTLCDPTDLTCVETQEVKACDAQGGCTSQVVNIYDPCAGKNAGDVCTLCDPTDLGCVETANLKVCSASGTCGG